MNLHNCSIPYTVTSIDVLRLTSKLAVILALRAHGVKIPQPVSEYSRFDQYYANRQWTGTRGELEGNGTITSDGKISPIRQRDPNRILIPTYFDYDGLTVSELKLLLTAHYKHRYSREPFRFTCTHRELADTAFLSERSIHTAVKALESKRLILTKMVSEDNMRTGTQYTLLDPEGSGASLYDIASFYKDRLDGMSIGEIYQECLGRYDPRDQLTGVWGPGIMGMMVTCPFCHWFKRSFRFSITETTDVWKCFRCGCGGNAARLWARLRYRMADRHLPIGAILAAKDDADNRSETGEDDMEKIDQRPKEDMSLWDTEEVTV